MICSNCGSDVKQGTITCPLCGEVIDYSKRKIVEEQADDPIHAPKRKAPLYVSIAAVLMASAIVAYFVIPIRLLQKPPSTETTSGSIPELTASSETASIPVSVDTSGQIPSTDTYVERFQSAEHDNDAEETAPQATSHANEDYILPHSADTLLTETDLIGLTTDELAYARNEIYARHGRMFITQKYQDYFNGKSWYEPKYTPEKFDTLTSALMTSLEITNATFISIYEKKLG